MKITLNFIANSSSDEYIAKWIHDGLGRCTNKVYIPINIILTYADKTGCIEDMKTVKKALENMVKELNETL